MPAHVIVGSQWGDEGKGRIADWLAQDADIVARYAGGDNAGHTVQVGDETFKLHIVPSGVAHPGVMCIMGGGMVVNPIKLMSELQSLDQRGIDISPDRIRLAKTAHVITPLHIAIDGASETQRGQKAIGTTKRGIGPAYTDKSMRTGLRTGMMGRPQDFAEQVKSQVERGNEVLTGVYNAERIDPDQAARDLYQAAEFLAPYLDDTAFTLDAALKENKTVLCEGAQGTLLDLDHGNYPYVTSSSPTVGGAITGLGMAPHYITRVVGVMKAYSTRVGGGPFPTELLDEQGDRLRGTGDNPWDEFGTTTGRPRRCGWLDTVVVRYSGRINGLTELAITKLDILSGFDHIEVADQYAISDDTLSEMPIDVERLEACTPIYQTLSGWQEDIMGVKAFDDLPQAAQDYVTHIEQLTGIAAPLVTVGPARSHTIVR